MGKDTQIWSFAAVRGSLTLYQILVKLWGLGIVPFGSDELM